MYSIGDPITGKRTDMRYEKQEDADIAAIEANMKDDKLWAVWDEDDGELVALAFQERIFD
jgi:hypothetical protein